MQIKSTSKTLKCKILGYKESNINNQNNYSKDIKTDSKQYMIDCLESEDRLVKQKNIRKKNHLDM